MKTSARTIPELALMIACGIGLAATFPRLATAANPPSASGRSLAVSTDQADATRAALEVLAAGGNAADGAIAAALALGVVNPTASGLGGGGFALVYSARDKKVSAFDFRERSPAAFAGDVTGVPGEPAGLELLSRRYGKKSLAVDAAPAIALAQHGFYVSAHLAEELERNKERIAAFGDLFPGGRPALFATRVKRPELGATLARYGSEGKRAIYEGPTAQRIVEAVKAVNGTMTLDDLAHYEVKERAPLTRSVGGRDVYTMPAPSAGGLMLLEVLGMYGASSTSPLANTSFGSSAYLHTIAEAMRGAFADRARFAADPDVDRDVDAAYQAALDPAQLAARRARIDPKKTHTPVEFKTRERGTSHLIVADAEGNIVSLTTTVNGPFGSRVVPTGTGIILNNELEDFTLPEEARMYGLKDGGPNRPRPGARPVSSMTPTIVLENDAPILAVGGSGGARIATGVTQATLARLVFDLDPNACVSAPRIHVQGVDLLVDPEIAADVRDGLGTRGEIVKDETYLGAAVQMIAWKNHSMLAASDPRKAGLSAAR